jgi:hypothetical protein
VEVREGVPVDLVVHLDGLGHHRDGVRHPLNVTDEGRGLCGRQVVQLDGVPTEHEAAVPRIGAASPAVTHDDSNSATTSAAEPERQMGHVSPLRSRAHSLGSVHLLTVLLRLLAILTGLRGRLTTKLQWCNRGDART